MGRIHELPGDILSPRQPWDIYFMNLAKLVATRSTCPRLAVGVVIVAPDKRIISTGYNGAPPGDPHCLDVGCDMVDGHCKRTIHGEINAIDRVSRRDRAGSTIYCAYPPCRDCAEVTARSGIVEWVYEIDYRGYGTKMKPFFDSHGIVFRQLAVASESELM